MQRVLKLRKRVTLMAVTVSVIFAVCWLTDSISYMLSVYTSAHTVIDITYVATSIMIMFNSAINPIVYALVNKRFREKIKRMIRCKNRLETDVIPLTGEPMGSPWLCRAIHPTLETRQSYNTRATYIWQEACFIPSKCVPARYHILRENIVHRRWLEPRSPAFKVDVITATPQTNSDSGRLK